MQPIIIKAYGIHIFQQQSPTDAAGAVYPSGAPDFSSILFFGVRVAQSFGFCVVICMSLFVHCFRLLH